MSSLSGTSQEMNLKEYVGELLKHHRARREYDALLAERDLVLALVKDLRKRAVEQNATPMSPHDLDYELQAIVAGKGVDWTPGEFRCINPHCRICAEKE